MNNEVLIVVQCRYQSTRLPGKALYPFAQGLPILAFLLRRLQMGLSSEVCSLVLATTLRKEDDVLEAWAASENVSVVRGEENDILARYLRCLECYPASVVVRVTADNPLTCPTIIKWLLQKQRQKQSDYVQCQNLPYGAGADLFSTHVLQKLAEKTLKPEEREHINLYILRHLEEFKVWFPEISDERARPDMRMTVDTLEDWQQMTQLFLHTDYEPWNLSLHEAITRMDRRSF